MTELRNDNTLVQDCERNSQPDAYHDVNFEMMSFPMRDRPTCLGDILNFCRSRLGDKTDFVYLGESEDGKFSYYKAFAGIMGDGTLAYNIDEMIAQCADEMGMSCESAEEFLDFNTFCQICGPNTPKYINPLRFPGSPEQELRLTDGKMSTYIPDCDDALVGLMETVDHDVVCVYNKQSLPASIKCSKYINHAYMLDPYVAG